MGSCWRRLRRGCNSKYPTEAQMKYHKERKQRKSRATIAFLLVSPSIFTRIKDTESGKRNLGFSGVRRRWKGKMNASPEFDSRIRNAADERFRNYQRLSWQTSLHCKLGKTSWYTNFPDSRMIQKSSYNSRRVWAYNCITRECKRLVKYYLSRVSKCIAGTTEQQKGLMRQERSMKGGFLVKSQDNYIGGRNKKGKNDGPQTLPACPTCKKTNQH